MKVRLLKKTRKRFEIHHLPNGNVGAFGERYEYNLFKLTDNTNSWFEKWAQLERKEGAWQYCQLEQTFDTEDKCVAYLKSLIIDRLRSEGNRGRKDHRMLAAQQKVWHNK